MKRIPLIIALICSTLSYGGIDKAPNCEQYFSTHQTDGKFQRMGNGLVQDPTTGLTWYRCAAGQVWAEGQCNGSALVLTFDEAKEWAESANLMNHDDWRVPKIDDMKSLIEADCKSPSINTGVFPGIEPEVYWSSETNFWVRSMAWSMFFYRGHYFNKQAKADAFRFMLVRN